MLAFAPVSPTEAAPITDPDLVTTQDMGPLCAIFYVILFLERIKVRRTRATKAARDRMSL